MTESVTYGQLERFLLSLGFKRYRAEGSHVFFEHKASGAGIVVKDYEPSEPVHSTKLVVICFSQSETNQPQWFVTGWSTSKARVG